MAVIKVTQENFEQNVLQSDVPVLVDFNADWCGPCQMLKPVLDELAESTENVKFASVNIDDEDELAEEYGVSSIPCLVLFKNGTEAARSIGFQPKDSIRQLWENH